MKNKWANKKGKTNNNYKKKNLTSNIDSLESD